MVTLALCGCLVGLIALLAVQRGRPHRPKALSTESENALDRGLLHLIKSIERETSVERSPPTVRTAGDTTSATVSARSRLARGTPASAVVLSSRPTTPLGATPTISRTFTPTLSRASTPMAAGSSSRIPVSPPCTTRTGFEDDDEAPTKRARTLPDGPTARR